MNFDICNDQPQRGSFGDVIFAISQGDNKEYALKALSLIDKVGRISDLILQSALQEVDYLGLCSCDRVVKLKQAFLSKDKNIFFIQMEKCQGTLNNLVDLNTKLEQIDTNLFIKVALELIEGIEIIHGRKFIFRDLSTENVLLTSDYHIKLCDFGKAKSMSKQDYRKTYRYTGYKGNRLYTPPELLEKLIKQDECKVEQTMEGDIWAYGIILIMLTGQSPEHIMSSVQLQKKPKIPKKLNDKLRKLIKKILCFDPKNRLKAKQIKEKLQKFQNTIISNKNTEQEYSQDEKILEEDLLHFDILKQYKFDYNAVGNIFYHSQKQSEHLQAERFFNLAILDQQNDKEIPYFSLGNLYFFKLQKYKEAEIQYKLSLTQNCDYIPALLNLAKLQEEKLNQLDRAEFNYRKVLSIDRENIRAKSAIQRIKPTLKK